MSGLSGQEQAEVRIKHDNEQDWENATEDDYDTVEVFDHVTLVKTYYINSVSGHESYTRKVSRDDSPNGPEPEAVTQRVARYLYDNFSIEVEARGIQIVDISSDKV